MNNDSDFFLTHRPALLSTVCLLTECFELSDKTFELRAKLYTPFMNYKCSSVV